MPKLLHFDVETSCRQRLVWSNGNPVFSN